MSNISEFLAEFQRKMTATISPITEAAEGSSLSQVRRTLSALARSVSEVTSCIEISHPAKDFFDSMRPLIVENQQFHTAMLSSMSHISPLIAGVVKAYNNEQYTMSITLSLQSILGDIVKSFDIYSYSGAVSQIATRLNEVGFNGGYDIDEEQRVEFENDLNDIAEDIHEQNWQQCFSEKILKWKEKNPLLAYLLDRILWSIFAVLLSLLPLFQIKTTQATMRDYPNVNAEVVIKVEHQQIVSVIDSQRNWVKVIYCNPVDGNLYDGWLSKRSCEPIEIEESEDHEIIVDIDNESESQSEDDTEDLEIVEDNEKIEEQ